jgi:quinol monooxygenase YgiN
MTFIISGTMSFDPAKHDECVAAMTKVVEATRGEAGCHAYGFYPDPTDPGTFRIFEHWGGQEPFDSHCQTAHYLAFMGAVGELGLTGADVNRYEVSSVQSLTGG